MRTGAGSARLTPMEHRSWVDVLSRAYHLVRRNLRGTPTDKQALNVGQKITDRRIQLFEHITVFLDDAIARNATQEEAEAFGQAILALVRSRYTSALPPLRVLVREEVEAQCLADPLQWNIDNPSPKDLADCAHATARHIVTAQRLYDGLLLHQYAGEQAA